jgi:hypothetical protein
VRWLCTFLSDPLDVPEEVVAYLAEHLGVTDVCCALRYTERRRTTRFEHAQQIADALGLVDFAEVDKSRLLPPDPASPGIMRPPASAACCEGPQVGPHTPPGHLPVVMTALMGYSP